MHAAQTDLLIEENQPSKDLRNPGLGYCFEASLVFGVNLGSHGEPLESGTFPSCVRALTSVCIDFET